MLNVIVRRTFGAAALSLAILGSAAFQMADCPSRPVLIVNATGQTITHFYASTPGFNVWEEDLLGDRVIPNGASARIDVNNGSGRCRYDFRARLADGTELDRWGVDVCRIAEYRFTTDEPERRADP
ncbi:hypothetical protein [Brevundimonas sp.]|uniref:hypothetical protein n=1 Tax=Brevundimonas sp. TaxID=1871086 RepID=UPI002737E203|nr:hypothetical protein [Brevundimonas sp.]MDP3800600.1 hypothetical protein [Brevundimonas sp.]